MNLLKTLKDLLPMLSLKYADNTRHLNSAAFKNSDSYKLLEGIRNEEFITEEEAINILCGNKKDARGSYRSLANKTLSVFLGNLFLKPTEYKTDYKSVYQECKKKALMIELLRSEGKQEAARNIATSTLKKSQKYHITEASKVLTRELMLQYLLRGNTLESNKYKELFEYYSEIERAELIAYTSLNEAALIASKYKKPKQKEINQIIKLLDTIINIEIPNRIKEAPYNLTFRKLFARILKANFLNDHKEAFKVSSDLDHYSEVINFEPPIGHIFNIKNKLTPSLIITKSYDSAQENIKKCLSMRVKGEHNWHITLQYQAILGFHSKNFELAKEAITLAKRNTGKLAVFMVEWWKIAEAYLYFISLIEKVQFDSKFKVSKFLNEFSVSLQDKQGSNVSILIIAEFLIKLALGDRDPLIEKKEAIRLYTYNNLDQESTKRSKIFFQILRKISRCAFDPAKFETATKAQLELLSSYPIQIQDLETELIRYEELYLMILEILKAQSKGAKKVSYTSKHIIA